jgi:hypothetical protein
VVVIFAECLSTGKPLTRTKHYYSLRVYTSERIVLGKYKKGGLHIKFIRKFTKVRLALAVLGFLGGLMSLAAAIINHFL